MSKRNDIKEGLFAENEREGLVYTEVLGWIDLGHARGDDIFKLMDQFTVGELSKDSYYNVTYSQGMTAPKKVMRTGKMITWRIKRGRPMWERKSIALAMMITVAKEFEKFQASFPNNFVTDSGYSCEDLVSDLLGFYRAVSTPHPFSMLQAVSKKEALKRWDYYGKIGSYKVMDFIPLLFPDPDKYPNARPRNGVLPPFMKSIVPYNDFLSGNVILPKGIKNFAIINANNGRMGL